MFDGRTLNGKVQYKAGGVGRNIAQALGKLLPSDKKPFFISAIGRDQIAEFLWNSLEHVDRSGIIRSEKEQTASCCVILDENGNCRFLIGSMNIHKLISTSQVELHADKISASPIVIIDGNLPLETIDFVLNLCDDENVPVWFEPTDVTTSTKPFLTGNHPSLRYTSPNFQELQQISSVLTGSSLRDISIENDNFETILEEAKVLAEKVSAKFIPNVMVTLGKYGVLMANKTDKISLILYRSPCEVNVVNVSGAGDCLASGYIAGLLNGLKPEDCVSAGISCAIQSLQSHSPVPENLIIQQLELQFTKIPLAKKSY